MFLTLFASLLIKVDVPDEDGYQTDIFGAGMVIVNLAIFVLGVLQVNTERLDIARELQSTREDGEEPREPADATAPAAGAPMFNFGSLEAGGGASNRVGPLVAGGGASNRGMGSIEEQRPASGTRPGEQRTADGGGSGFLQSLEDREQFLEQLADGEGAAGEKSQKEDLEQLDADGEAIQSLQLASSNDRIAASLRPAVEQASDERVASTPAVADEPFSFRQQLSASDERRVASALTAADEPFSFRQQLAASDSRRPPDKKAGGMGGLLLSRPGPH